jgi:hypothetical protein
LFEALRHFAYRHVVAFKDMGSFEAWRKRLMQEAQARNGFAVPLGDAELRSIATSTAKWTWRRFSRRRLSEIQAERAAGRAAGALTAASIADAIPQLAGPNLADAPNIPKAMIADHVGKSTRTLLQLPIGAARHRSGRGAAADGVAKLRRSRVLGQLPGRRKRSGRKRDRRAVPPMLLLREGPLL